MEPNSIDQDQWWYSGCYRGDYPECPESLDDNAIENIRLLRNRGNLSPFPQWEDAVANGIVTDRAGYLSLLRLVAIGITVRDLESELNEEEVALIHLVRILDETDQSLSRLSEKIEDYYIALHPAERTMNEQSIRSLIDSIAKDAHHPLHHLAKTLTRLQESRVTLATCVRKKASVILPNMSALCGTLVAARLLAKSGSKKDLARVPASSLQVLGAGPSLFTHLATGTNPPKHGIIYQYKGIHHAKRKFRGRVSRVVACQLGIAAKIDYYRGSRDPLFLQKAEGRICRAGNQD